MDFKIILEKRGHIPREDKTNFDLRENLIKVFLAHVEEVKSNTHFNQKGERHV